MVEETSLEFRITKIDETINYLLDEIKHNHLMCAKCKNTCKYLNYVEDLLIVSPTITNFVSISAFASLVCFPASISSSAVRIKICAITAGIKKYESVIRKKKKKHDKIVMLQKKNFKY